jgi:putative hemolysin
MEILILGLLIILNGFFAISEIAIISSRRTRLEQLKKEGHKGAEIALRLIKDSESFLSAIQVGITLIGIITGVYGGISIANDVSPFFQKFELLKNSAYEIALIITVIIITYFSILIGELVPKTVALSNPEKIAIKIATPIFYFSLIFHPFVKLLAYSTSLINRIIGVKKQVYHMTEADLIQMLKIASREGVIKKDQNRIHEKVFYFSDKKAKHIMTHRMEVDWIDVEQPIDVIKENILKSKHTRLVCCKGNLDNFQGTLSVKDFLTACSRSDEINIAEILTQPFIIPDSADAYKVLNLFKQYQTHFCIVVNEYGSFEGIITLHDILENLIGEIADEGETTEPDIFVRDDKSFLLNGDAPVEILDGIFDNYMTDFDKIDYSTVAGFVLNKIDKIPQIGDRFTYNNYIIEIVDIDGQRIDKILVRKK